VKIAYFYVFAMDEEPPRKEPIGVWVWCEGDRFDMVFDEAFPLDEQRASDCCNRLIESNLGFTREALEYWQEHVGYDRCASEIHEVADAAYAEVFRRFVEEVHAPK